MRKNNITISFTYSVNETPKANLGSIDDAIASELLAIKAAEQGAKAMRETLRGFIKANIGAINPDAIEAILKTNKWSKQDISDEMLKFGLRRRETSEARLAISQKLQAIAESEFAALRKRYTLKEVAAIGRRIQKIAQERK
jgi:hypothetical protein